MKWTERDFGFLAALVAIAGFTYIFYSQAVSSAQADAPLGEEPSFFDFDKVLAKSPLTLLMLVLGGAVFLIWVVTRSRNPPSGK
jgi:threonine/homoserine/homoserine lactone efflux protein